MRVKLEAWLQGALGYVLLAVCAAAAASLLTWSIADPSFMRATSGPTRNALGPIGANFSDLVMRLFGLAGVFIILPPAFWSLQLITRRRLDGARMKLTLACVAVLLLACAASSLPAIAAWPLANGLGGLLGDQALRLASGLLASVGPGRATPAAGILCLAGGMLLLMASLGMSPGDVKLICQGAGKVRFRFVARTWRRLQAAFDRHGRAARARREPMLDMPPFARGRATASRIEPRFDWEAAPAPFLPVTSNAELSLSRSASDGEFDGVTDRTCHAMAQRFAPDLDPPRSASRLLSRQAAGRKHAAETGARAEGASYRSSATLGDASRLCQSSSAARRGRAKPIWPGSVPAPVGRDTPGTGRNRRPGGDKLYGRAVAIVRADPKTSADHLQERLGIRYRHAADLIERMVQEGILGAPVRIGVRPILHKGRHPRIV